MRSDPLKNILVGLCITGALVLAFPLYAYLSVDGEPPIGVKPVELVETDENGGSRCPRRRWASLSEGPVCYTLQEKLGNASWSGDAVAVLESLRIGANIEGAFYQAGTAINTATMKGNLEVVKTLIENGADVNSPGKWNESPLHIAVIYDQLPIAKVLLENGANVCHQAFFDDLSTPTALDLAIEKRSLQMIKLLTAYGAPFCSSQYGLNIIEW